MQNTGQKSMLMSADVDVTTKIMLCQSVRFIIIIIKRHANHSVSKA